jgi:hypothetical protein
MTDLPTPWERARKTRSRAQEERLGALPGGQQGVNSGRFWRWKRDGQLRRFLVECRTNEKPTTKSYRIDYDEFQDIRKEASQVPPGLLPAMQIDIRDLKLMLVDLDVFMEREERLFQMEAQLDEINRSR